MPNAIDATQTAFKKFLILGPTGSGKSSQILTLPGKKFAYIFDPNTLTTLRGHDIDYEEFLVEGVSLDVVSLSKERQDKGAKIVKGNSTQYVAWEKDFSDKIESGFFDDYDAIGMDSATTFLDLIMDYVLTINGRAGAWPNQDDYGPQMVTFTNVVRTLTSMKKTLYFTGHLMYDKDDLTQKIYRFPVMTGRLKEKIPLLFSDILVTGHDVDKDNQSVYVIQTKPDNRTPTIRCSIRGLEMFENVTIDWAEDPVGQGLGGILAWEASQLAEEMAKKNAAVKAATKGSASKRR